MRKPLIVDEELFRRLYVEGLPMRAIETACGLSYNSGYSVARALGLAKRAHPRNVNDGERAEMTQLARQGLSVATIAARIERAPETVRAHLALAGLVHWRARQRQPSVHVQSVVDAEDKPSGGIRPCLRCRRRFSSDGKHNRLCATCNAYCSLQGPDLSVTACGRRL